MIKNNISNIIIGVIALTVLFVPEAKALVHQGMMKVGFFQPKFEETAPIPTSEEAINFRMVKDTGEQISLADLEGKVVFLNFWATWCGPCIAEMPSLQILYDKVKNDPEIEFVTVEVQSAGKKAKAMMDRKGFDFPVYFPASNIPSEIFKGNLPTTVIFDKKGNVAHTTIGMADYSGQNIIDFLNEVKAMN